MNEAESIAAADATMYMALTGRRPVVEKSHKGLTIRGAWKRLQLSWVCRAPRLVSQKLEAITSPLLVARKSPQ